MNFFKQEAVKVSCFSVPELDLYDIIIMYTF